MEQKTAGTPPSAAAQPSGPRHWVRANLDRVPTKWLTTGILGIALAATAGFGGLATVAVAAPPEIGQDEHVVGADLDMSVVRVVLADDVEGAGVRADLAAGERVLAMVVDVTNLHPNPRSATQDAGLITVRLPDRPDDAPSISREDGFGEVPVLQPDVPTRLLLSWVVAGDEFRAGDELRIALPAADRIEGKIFVDGEWWEPAGAAAFATAPIEDLGAAGTR